MTGTISKLTERELRLEDQLEKAIAPISTIRSHVPSLVVSVSKILSRPIDVGTTKGWFFLRILAITTAFLCAATISFTVCKNLLFGRLLAITKAFMCSHHFIYHALFRRATERKAQGSPTEIYQLKSRRSIAKIESCSRPPGLFFTRLVPSGWL